MIEKVLKPETLQLYNTRYEESYNANGNELYAVWSKLKQLSLSDQPEEKEDPLALLPAKQKKVAPVFEEVLTYLEPQQGKSSKQGKGTSGMPKHLSSDQVIA